MRGLKGQATGDEFLPAAIPCHSCQSNYSITPTGSTSHSGPKGVSESSLRETKARAALGYLDEGLGRHREGQSLPAFDPADQFSAKDGPMRLGQRLVNGLWVLVAGITMIEWSTGRAWTRLGSSSA
jgi:hypothetical protein